MRSILLLALFALAAPAMAQDADSELWLTGGAKIALSDPTDLETEVIARWGDDPDGLYEVEMTGALAHEVAKGLTLGGGYVRTVNYSRGAVTRTEDRFRVQIGLSGDAGPVKLSGRVRLEHRNRSDGDDIGYRLRPQVKATLPIGGPFSLVASHESFIPLNDTDWQQRAGYERIRNMVGVAWKASKTIGVEAGYLNQYAFGRNGARDTMDNVLSLSVALSL